MESQAEWLLGSVRVCQIPLRLAWGNHDAQEPGSSLDKVEASIDNLFCDGQGYVCAVKSCVRLAVCGSRALNPRSIRANLKVVNFYRSIGGLPALDSLPTTPLGPVPAQPTAAAVDYGDD